MPTEQELEHSDAYNAGYKAGKKDGYDEGWGDARERVREALGIQRVSLVFDDGEGEDRPDHAGE